MQRVMIIGSVGAGKTTLGTRLARLFGLPVVHLDEIVWQSGCRTIADEDFFALHRRLIAGDAWLIEGVGPWESWDERAAAADTLVLPDYSQAQAARWVLRRQARALLGRQPASPPGCPIVPMTLRLLRWVRAYRREMRPHILALADRERRRGKAILRLTTPAAMERALRELGRSG